MSAARLILKQPTGWFAAGREVAQALALLSDGAFKLYMHLCLEADRRTGRAGIELAAWARLLRKDAAAVAVDLDEFQRQGICKRRPDRVEICDRFWPYQKQVAEVVTIPPQSSYAKCGLRFWRRRVCVRPSLRPMRPWRGSWDNAA